MNWPWKKAWIVGASSGLGAEISRKLSMSGTKVFISARREEVLNDVCDGLENTHAVPLDITSIEECRQAVSAVLKINAKLPDLIILNAAIYTPMSSDNLDPYECANMIDVNYMGVVNMFIESMKPELSQVGFDLRLVNPGFIKTRLTDKNDFNMPQLMEVDDAAMRTLKGLATNKFDIAFPNPFIFYLKVLRILPYRLFFILMRRMVAKRLEEGP